MKIETYREQHFAGLKELWDSSFPDDPPWNRAEVVAPLKSATQPELFIVSTEPDRVIGAALAGYDGHRGWLYSVAVAETKRRMGIGSGLVRELEARLEKLGCKKINLQVRSLNIALVQFYYSLGYRTNNRISMGRRIQPWSVDKMDSQAD